MQKITTTLKTIFLAIVILIMIQSCVPNSSVPIPSDSLTGKIKNFKMKVNYPIPFSNLFDRVNNEYVFNYDSTYKVKSIDVLDSTGTAIFPQIIVTRSTNKVTVTQNKTAGYIAEDIFFLHTNTNYVDSFYTLENSEFLRKTIIVRNNLNNIERTEQIQYYGNVAGNYDTLILDSFIYVNNNIVSYNERKFGSATGIIKREFKFNTSLTANTNVNAIFQQADYPTLYINLWHFNVDILGISLGNESKNVVSSYREIYDNPNIPFFPDFSFDVYTATQNKLLNDSYENNYY